MSVPNTSPDHRATLRELAASRRPASIADLLDLAAIVLTAGLDDSEAA